MTKRRAGAFLLCFRSSLHPAHPHHFLGYRSCCTEEETGLEKGSGSPRRDLYFLELYFPLLESGYNSIYLERILWLLNSACLSVWHTAGVHFMAAIAAHHGVFNGCQCLASSSLPIPCAPCLGYLQLARVGIFTCDGQHSEKRASLF